MAGEILTPITVWKKFKIDNQPVAETIGEYKDGNIVLERLRINGRVCKDGQVKIYAVIARDVRKTKQPAIFILQKFTDAASEKLCIEYAKKGFIAMVVDLSGEDGVNNNYTVYPESLSYANYKNAKNNMNTVTDEVTDTCWYEWGVTLRYALKYLQGIQYVEKIGALGICDAATVLWHLAGTTEVFDCVAFVMNAGWKAYKGKFKFRGDVDEQFSDEQLKYIAGIEPQSYASRIKCPVMLSVCTNSNEYDFDRAHDTFARISAENYKTIYYSVGSINCVNQNGFDSINLFFENFLKKNQGVTLPSLPQIKVAIENGKTVISVLPDTKNVKEVCVFVAEQQYNPSLRQWLKIMPENKTEKEYTFEYLPYMKSGVVFAFAVCTYKNGFVSCSDVVAKKFAENEVAFSYHGKVLYSSREKNSQFSFYPAIENNEKPDGLIINQTNRVEVKKGSMGIEGVYCKGGLITFNAGTEKYLPEEGNILMLDVYVKKQGTVTVKLICDYFEKKCEYLYNANVFGGEVWHNLKISLNQFKTADGMVLKKPHAIQAIEISCEQEYLINNLLWV